MIKIIVFLCMDYRVFKFFLYWQLFISSLLQEANINRVKPNINNV